MPNISVFEGSKVPAFLKNAALTSELTANVGSGSFPVLSIKGKVFALASGGERQVLMSPHDEDSPATSLNIVIIKANSGLSKVWYAKNFVEGSDAKPDCFSHDGIKPDPVVENPQAVRCSICPKNAWGSKISDDGKKLKACSDSRRLAIANVDEIDTPILLRVPPASLRPLAEFGEKLAGRGVPYYAVVTRLGFDAERASPLLTFKPTGWLTEAQFAQVQKVQLGAEVAAILGAAPPAHAVPADDLDGSPPQGVSTPSPAPTPTPAQKAAQKPAKRATAVVADPLTDDLSDMLDSLDD